MNYLVPLVTSIGIISCSITYVLNPGIRYSYNNSNNNNKISEKIYCENCKFLYPYNNTKMKHCFYCNICVFGYDHHCGVIGKCVGRYNMIIFIVLALSGYAFFPIIIIIIINLVNR